VTRMSSVQPRYSLLFREIERELLPLCAEEGIAVIPFNPLAGGMLTGKHKPGGPTQGTRFTLGTAAELYQKRYWHDREFATISSFVEIAGEAGLAPATLAVAWVLANPVITAPIIGASRPDQLAASVAALDAKLSPALKQRLDELTAEYRKGDAPR
jgi:aryl-alcohol dehydrogenase-like predicted oxidoreductase